ncbi:MAG: PAS domain S-box protein [Sphingobacteriales bacterium]|nr:MAG: PAS domain S-box protein [Sphingobacteriales bacterium]
MLTPLAAELEYLKEEYRLLKQENEALYLQMIEVEKQALERQLMFSQLSKASFEGIVLYKENQIVLVNDAFYHLFGIEHRQLEKIRILDLVAPEHQKEALHQAEQTDKDWFETICVKQNGTRFPARVRRKFIPHQGIDAMVIVFSDLTNDKRVEQELIQSELLYQKLFEESRDAIYISGLKGELLEVNPAALELFGYSREEMLGMSALKLYANPQEREKFRNAMQEHGSVSNYEVILVKKDGTEIDCLLSSTTRRNAQMEIIGYQGIIRDITQRKRTDELVRAKALAERSTAMKAQFLANMSHEIRTPMNAVMGMTHLLQDTQLSTEQKRYVNGIHSASEHLLVLINDILDFSKIEAGKLQLEEIEFSLREVINNIADTFKYKVKEKNLDLIINIDEHIPDILIGDPTRLRQILMNLVSNSVKFTEKGHVQLDVRMFTDDKQAATIAFAVTDTGIGIASDKLDNIFDSFSQVNRSATRLYGGTGLGLAITKKLIEMQGGTISVKSKIFEGTTFLVVLKFVKANNTILPNHKHTLSEMAVKPLGKLRLLIVEDNELNRVVTIDTIKKWGKDITIDIAENGEEGVKKVKKHRYDLVLMDVQMPKMNGYEATQYIRKTLGKTNLPILAMTAYATTGEAEKTITSGMNDYISKPFDPKQLYQKIARMTSKDSGALKMETNNSKADTEPDKKSEKVEIYKHVTNLDYLDESIGGDEDLKIKMLEIMLRETPDEVEQMEKYFQEENWERLKAVAHKFKSTVAYMGLNGLKEVVNKIQVNAEKKENPELTKNMIAEVKNICLLACQELKEELTALKTKTNSTE